MEKLDISTEELEILQAFADNLLEAQQDLDSAYATLVNEHFWELV